MTGRATLALLESRLARAAGDILEATRAAAFDPCLAAGGGVGAVLCLAGAEGIHLLAAAGEGLPLAAPLLRGMAAELEPHLAEPGDVVAAADPDLGLAAGEVAMARGAYVEGRLVGIVASLAVHDGLSPALAIAPVRLVAGDRLDPALAALIAVNSRRPGVARGDLLAQASGLAPGVRALERLASVGGLEAGARYLAAAAAEGARAVLRGRPAGEPPAGPEAAVTVADPDDGPAPRLRLTLVPDGSGGVLLDFGGSELFRPGLPALPARRSAALARLAVAGALPEVPCNDGLLDAVRVRLPAGSVLDPGLPPGCEGRPGEGWRLEQRVIDLAHRALSGLVPARALAGSGDGGTLVLTAADRPGRPGWRCRLPLGGGAGASAGADGLSNVPAAAGAAPTPPIEALEAAYPIRLLQYALREGSSGPGRYRGGAGTEIALALAPDVPCEEVRCEWLGPAAVAAPGLLGGGAGAPGEALVAGGRVAVRTGGGGGYGNPYERAIRLVLADVEAGLLEPGEAKRRYGVALRPAGSTTGGRPEGRVGPSPGGFEVDEERTYRIRSLVLTSLALDEL